MYKRIKIENLTKLLLFFLLAISFLAIISTSYATDITIGPNTPGGLKQAIETAQNGDTIYMENGVYKGANNRGLNINKSINIQGKGKNVIIDAQGKDRIFLIVSYNQNKFYKISVTFRNLKMTNGNTKGYGGAIYSYNSKNLLKVIDCIFTNNKGSSGGAISGSMARDNYTFVKGCVFKNNIANYGGALARIYSVSNSNFTKNKASSWTGGAIQLALLVSNCIFTKNQAALDGGAIGSSPALKITKSVFNNNKAKQNGGAILHHPFSKEDSLTIENCKFKKNNGGKGGAICIQPGVINSTVKYSLIIKNTKFENNIAKNKYNAYHTLGNVKVTKKNVKITPKDGTKVKK